MNAAVAAADPRARLAWFGYLAMMFGNFMAILDIQIVASSINQLQAGLSASADEIQWVQTSYLIAEVIAIPLSGYLSRLMSTRVYFTISAIGFTLASAACSLAWNLESMIVFRVLQGFLVLLLACWLGVTWWGNPVAYNAAPVNFIFLGTPLILAAGLAAWWNGYRAARFFVLATMVSLSGALCTALTVSGWLPYTFATFHAAEFGILIDVVLLSLALGDRIKLLRDQHHATQQAMLEQKLHASDMLAQVNADLERTVQERTAELARARDEAERQARTDGLTGVANRRCFEEVAAREVARAQRYQQPLSIILFDIDLFKQVNDLHGHAAGDAVIRTAASVVREAIREVDFVARVGGEEFAILLPGIHQAQAVTTAERLRELIAEREAVHQDLRLRLTASLGVSECRADDPGFGALLHRADQAMYVAKQRGRNRVAVAPDAPGAPDVPEAPAA